MRKERVRQTCALVAAMCFWTAQAAIGQSFSCPIGREPACLDYGDRVVDQSAACFESYQCNYEGFTCKSNLTDLAADYDALLSSHNDLVDDYNELLKTAKRQDSALDDIRDCLQWVSSVEDARLCASR